MKSNTKINEQTKKKTNPELVGAIIAAKKNESWKRVAEILSSPRKNKREENLTKINAEAKEGDVIVVPGKVLSMGELNKKIKIVALSFSKGAEEKILKANSTISTIVDEIKKNPTAKAVKILE
ncbi:MAG TPA: 50S ribosomal protein L18e [Candidatus Pacearchaeota archaeon]|nr:50S ribosomal protein L18e [Candidatus Pacearchaeota archaeon]